MGKNLLTGIIPQYIAYLSSYAIYDNYFCPPYPSATVIGYQNTSNCTEYIQGNINNDDMLDILDVIMGVDFILNENHLTNYEYWALDLDGDGSHDINDIVYLVQLIMYHQ